MSTGPFAIATPACAAAGIPTVPCAGKAAIVTGWTGMTVEQSLDLISSYGYRNVGALGGASSGIVFLDDDTDDPRVAQLIREALPASPWVRVGKKGAAYAYRYGGHGTFTIMA